MICHQVHKKPDAFNMISDFIYDNAISNRRPDFSGNTPANKPSTVLTAYEALTQWNVF